MPEGWQAFTFQYFVRWDHNTPGTSKNVLMSRLVVPEPSEDISTVDDQTMLDLFNASDAHAEWQALQQCLGQYGKQVVPLLLPEIPTDIITEKTPVWTFSKDKDGNIQVRQRSLRCLRKAIRRERGGPAKLGDKGLTYGTSAIECHLATTDDIFPGDADAVIFNESGVAQRIIEYKKHTLWGPIGNNLVTQYYPWPDGRKYQAIQALASDLHPDPAGHIPMTVFYFTNRTPHVTRLQDITRLDANAMHIGHDTGDLPAPQISAAIQRLLLPNADEGS